MNRKYSKRTKSTGAKSYADYLSARNEMITKGYTLKDQMDKDSFEMFYGRLREAKRVGEIKSQPWQELLRRERYTSTAQSEIFLQTAKYMPRTELPAALQGKKKITLKDIKQLEKSDIFLLGSYLNEHKTEEGLFGGRYE